MSEDHGQDAVEKEDPKVFRVAQLPVAGDAIIHRRTFVKGAVTAAGAGAAMSLLAGCESDDDEHPFVEGDDLPGEEGTVQRGETGINITSESGQTRTMPCGSAIPDGWVCTCNCVTVANCSCDGHCSCDGQSSGSSSHYWYPC